MLKYLLSQRELSRNEYLADLAIHAIGLAFAVVGGAWLLLNVALPELRAPLAVYSIAQIMMLAASAAYNVAADTYRAKEILRRIDHAAIYLMIAGAYTPFAVARLADPAGDIILWVVWIAAGFGVGVKLLLPQGFETLSVALYIAMGWIAIAVAGQLYETLDRTAFFLILSGGIVYSLGAPFHLLRRCPYNKVIWHAFVLVAAILQFAGVAIEFG